MPTIHFGTGTATLLRAMAAAGGDVIGLDWRIPLDRGWDEVGHDRGVQGNLDPALLLGPWERVEARGGAILDRAGVGRATSSTSATASLPRTDPATLTRLAAFVRERSARARCAA